MRYDCIVVGSGAAGLTVSIGLSSAGKKVLLIEKEKFGGECTWNGCVPSKSLIKISKKDVTIEEALKSVREKIEMIAKEEDKEALEKYGMDVVVGEAKFISENTLSVNGNEYEGKNIVIATGSRPFIPPIEGLDKIDFITNEEIFKQETLPKKIVMIGGGVISLELSFALKNLGIDVTILERGNRLVPPEDKVISDFYIKKLEEKGIKLILEAENIKIEKNDIEEKVICSQGEFIFEKLFLSTGRASNVESLDLEKAGIEFNKGGIIVDENLLTNKKHIYAIGDVVGPYRFSHIAGYHGEIVVRNILFPYIKKKVKYSSVPWTIFSDPEFGRMGMNEEEVKKEYKDYKKYEINYEKNERSIVTDENDFYLKVLCDKKYKILGAYCIGERAGEIIGMLQILHSQDLQFYKLVESIQAYPTYGDSLRKLAKKAFAEHLREIFTIGS